MLPSHTETSEASLLLQLMRSLRQVKRSTVLKEKSHLNAAEVTHYACVFLFASHLSPDCVDDLKQIKQRPVWPRGRRPCQPLTYLCLCWRQLYHTTEDLFQTSTKYTNHEGETPQNSLRCVTKWPSLDIFMFNLRTFSKNYNVSHLVELGLLYVAVCWEN